VTPEQKLARAQRWSAFYAEPGGLAEMLAHLTEKLMAEAVQGEPWETDKLKKIALGIKIVGMLKSEVLAVTIDGKLAEHAELAAKRIAELPERKRKWAGFA
jgi:hypothetical protein